MSVSYQKLENEFIFQKIESSSLTENISLVQD